MNNTPSDADAELEAMRSVYVALKELDSDAQNRVLDYVVSRLSLRREKPEERTGSSFSPRELAQEIEKTRNEPVVSGNNSTGDEFEGVSPVAQKWARRNNLSFEQLSRLFSLGVDEIELVAKSVPG